MAKSKKYVSMLMEKLSGYMLVFAFFMAVVLFLSAVKPLDVYAREIIDYGNCGEEGSDVRWELDNEGTLTIKGQGTMKNYKNIATGYPWLAYNNAIKKVIVEDGVKNIAERAFSYYYSEITDLEVGKDVEVIDHYSFYQCTSLATVTFSEESKCTTLGTSCFEDCTNLKNISLPATVEEADDSFYGIEDFTVNVYSWDTFQALRDSLYEMGTICLKDDISAESDNDSFYPLRDVEIDLNGYKMDGSALSNPAIVLDNGVILNLKGNGSIIGNELGILAMKESEGPGASGYVGKVVILGGEITVSGSQYGIYVDDSASDAAYLKGAVNVNDGILEAYSTGADGKEGICLNDGYFNLSQYAKVYTGTSKETAAISTKENYIASPTKYVKIDCIPSEWETLQEKIETAYESEDHTLVLDKDYTAKDDEKAIKIPEGKTLILDLNGHSITNNYGAFSVYGDFTINDSVGTGSIKADVCGYGNGGGIIILSGKVTLNAGTVSGFFYAGVRICGGTFTMNGGTIKKCCENTFSSGAYGNVYVQSGRFYLNGGTITDSYQGNGVYIGENGVMYVSGNPVVSGNSPSDVRIGSTPIIISGALTDGASIGIRGKNNSYCFAIPEDDYTLTDSDAEKFFSDSDSYVVAKDDLGLYLKNKIADNDDYSFFISSEEYCGEEITPSVEVWHDGKLTENVDFTVSFKKGDEAITGMVDAGKYTAVITGKGDYTGTVEKSFDINPKELLLAWDNIEIPYNGSEQVPVATATNLADGDECEITVSGGKKEVGDNYIAMASEVSNPNYKLHGGIFCSYSIVLGNKIPNAPQDAAVGYPTDNVSKFKLPENWKWSEKDSNKDLVIGENKVTAIYNGEDMDSYVEDAQTVEFIITRNACTHQNTEVRNAKTATKTEDGYTGDTYCKDCNLKLKTGQVIPATGNKPAKKGTILKDKKYKYVVTSSSEKNPTVSFKGLVNSKLKTVKIPAKVKFNGVTYKVTGISPKALKNKKKVTKVIIGANVTKIGKGAFGGCKKLKTVKCTKNKKKLTKKLRKAGLPKKVKIK